MLNLENVNMNEVMDILLTSLKSSFIIWVVILYCMWFGRRPKDVGLYSLAAVALLILLVVIIFIDPKVVVSIWFLISITALTVFSLLIMLRPK